MARLTGWKPCAGWQSVFGGLKQKAGLASFTTEPGKVCYYEARDTLKQMSEQYTGRTRELVPPNKDGGGYRVKISGLSTAAPRT